MVLLKVYDIAGKLVVSKTATSSVERVALPSVGMCFVEVNIANTTKTVKVIRFK